MYLGILIWKIWAKMQVAGTDDVFFFGVGRQKNLHCKSFVLSLIIKKYLSQNI